MLKYDNINIMTIKITLHKSYWVLKYLQITIEIDTERSNFTTDQTAMSYTSFV